MGAIGGLLGVSGGAGGTGFNSPQGASQQEADTTYNQANNALAQQQGFVNGLVNQANPALSFQSGALQGYANLANGQGPNPAQAQLQQATGQNVANQAALMAGQRGSNANVGLIGRQAAMQGANTQQQAIGQAASLQAQQQLQGLQGMAGQANQVVGQAQQGLGSQVSGTQGLNSNVLNSLNNQNSANASMANTTMQGQQGLLGGLMNSTGGITKAVGSLFADGGPVIPGSGKYADIDPNAPDVFDTINQPAPAKPAIATKSAVAKTMPANVPPTSVPQNAAPDFGNRGANALYAGASSFGQFLANSASNKQAPQADAQINMPMAGGPQDSMSNSSQQPDTMVAAKGGKVPALVSPGEQYLPPQAVKKVLTDKANPLSIGERIPGKPKHPGNDYRNDVVPKTLESGGVVIPNEIMQKPNAHWEAMKFVHAAMAKNRKK